MDWTNLTFILGNVVGMIIKSRPNVGVFKDKFIIAWILVSQLVAQFIAGLGGTPEAPEVGAAGQATLLAGFGLGAFGKLLIDSIVQTALAVLLSQVKKQAGKPA